jgi:purine-nucleoside phosphorylase
MLPFKSVDMEKDAFVAVVQQYEAEATRIVPVGDSSLLPQKFAISSDCLRLFLRQFSSFRLFSKLISA